MYPRLLYWYARSLEKTEVKKNQTKAKQTYRKLVNDFPFSFYAILAAKRIDSKIKTPSMPELEGTPPVDGIEYFALIDDLNENDHHDAARAVLELALYKNPDWEKNHTEYLTKKLIESQNYRKALDLASNHFNSGVYGPITGAKDKPMLP